MELRETNRKKLYIPSSFAILFAIMIIFVIASWIGQIFNSGIKPVGILDIFPAAWQGFLSKADVILFIFAIGGTLGVMTKLKAIDAGIQALVTKLKGKEWLLISSLTIIFGLNGTAYGLWEETIVFFPVLIPIFVKANYGAFTAVAMILIGCGTGVLASTINPFAVGTAVTAITKTTVHDVTPFADFSLATGQGLRWLNFIIFQAIAVTIVLLIAKYNKKRLGVIKGVDNDRINAFFGSGEKIIFTRKRKIALILFVLAFVIMIIGLLPWTDFFNLSDNNFWNRYLWWFASTNGTWEHFGKWTFISSAAVFLLITIVIFALCASEFEDDQVGREASFIASYGNGIKDMLIVSLIIAVASGLGIILQQTKLGDFIAQSISSLASYHLIVWAIGVFIISLILSFLVPSTSGFALAFIPIFTAAIAMGTPTDKQQGALVITILAFVMASGIINLIAPTSAALVAYTTYSKIPYFVWVRNTYYINLIYVGASLVILIAFAAFIDLGVVF